MALFKILKGTSTDLKDVKGTEGYAYFTPDDGKFYIDIKSTKTANDVGIGGAEGTVINENGEEKEVTRICINGFDILDCGDATTK